jgi:hypothetical protein
MRKREHLGQLELMVLFAVIQPAKDSYGVQISREIAEKSGREVVGTTREKGPRHVGARDAVRGARRQSPHVFSTDAGGTCRGTRHAQDTTKTCHWPRCIQSMNAPTPPKLAMVLLDRFGSPYHRDSLAGDLIEQFQQGRSSKWVWWQVFSAILASQMRAIEAKPWCSIVKTTMRVINAVMLAAALAFGVGTLTRADSPQKTCVLQARC